MTDATLKLIISLQDKASAGLKSIQSALSSVAGGVGSVASGFADFVKGAAQFAVGGLIQKGIEGIAGSIGALKDGMIQGNAEFETYQTQFGVLLGGADAAKERLADLAKFGATTPFELPEVVRADKIMQSFGLHAQDAAKRFGFAGKDIRTIAGDVASGTGASFEDIASYIGKFASGATGETIARFQELGIVTKTQLSQMGLAFDKGGSLIINSQADLDRATAILLKSMKDKYGGMMNAQSATFEGMMSNLEDWKAGTLRTLGAPLFDVLKGQLAGLLAFLPTLQPKIDALAQTMAGNLKTALDWLTGTGIPLLRAGFERIVPIFEFVAQVIYNFRESLSGGVIFAIGVFIRNMLQMAGIDTGPWLVWLARIRMLEAAFNTAAATVSGVFHSAWAWLTDTAIPAARDGFAAVADRLSGPLTAAWAWLTGTGLPLAMSLFSGLGDILSGGFKGGAYGALEWLSSWIVTATGFDISPLLNGMVGLLNAVLPLAPSFQAVADAVKPVIDGFSQGGLGGGLAALRDNIIPILGAVNDLRTNIVAFALEGIGGLIQKFGEGNPLLMTVGQVFKDLGTTVQQVSAWFTDSLLPAVIGAGQGFLTMLMPHLTALADILLTNVWPILQEVGAFIGNNLPGFLNVVAPLITGLVNVGLAGLELALRAIATVWTTYLEPAFVAIGGWLEKITGGWDNLARGAEAVEASFQKVADVFANIGKAGGIGLSDIGNAWKSLGITLPGFAGGVSNFAGGMALVGERGPEIVSLPRGASVTPNHMIPAFADGVGTPVGGMNVTINVAGDVVTERQLIQKVQAGLLDIMRRSPTGSTGIS